jgi:20S proteasome subunit alpha 2
MSSEARYGLTTFSPSGELVQIKYAQNAVNKGATALGVKALDGVVLAAEKKTPSPLVDPSTVQKVFKLDEHVGCTYSGLGPDTRVLVDRARKDCQMYRLRYHEAMPVSQLVRAIANVFQEFTQSGGVRPFGVSLLVAGVDETGYHLYQLDPSGTFLPWKAVATGKNATSAKTFLEKRYQRDIEIEDAIHTSLTTLKEGLDGQMTAENTEVGRVVGGKFEILNKEQLGDYIDQI